MQGMPGLYECECRCGANLISMHVRLKHQHLSSMSKLILGVLALTNACKALRGHA